GSRPCGRWATASLRSRTRTARVARDRQRLHHDDDADRRSVATEWAARDDASEVEPPAIASLEHQLLAVTPVEAAPDRGHHVLDGQAHLEVRKVSPLDLVAAKSPEILGPRVPKLDEDLAVDHHHSTVDSAQYRFQVLVREVELAASALQLVVDGLQ